MRRIICASLLVVAPAVAAAQVQFDLVYNCEVTQECSQEGKCNVKTETVVFGLTEKDVQQHGEGTYEITYSGITTDAQMLTQFGPMVWSVKGEDIQTLTSIGVQREMADTDGVSFMTWSRVRLSELPTGLVNFLRCEVR